MINENNATSTIIYVLRHEYELDGYDTMKILGVYSNRFLANEAQARFAKEPGFHEHQEGFIIEECRMNQDLWSGGFVTVPVGPSR